VAKLFPTFDLFVSPSRTEPFGLVIVEAMASGIPVVASKSEGALEIIDDRQTGRLVPIKDAEALAHAILDLLSDEKERVRLSENARRVVHERFSLERMLEETEEVYRDVVGVGARRAFR
jgi:glycosyltransferase involved in cell wall biosynthesis